MMERAEKRQRMKALAIMRFIVEQNIKMFGAADWRRVHMVVQIESQSLAMNQTPAKLFRHDRPELDKRRYKRYQRTQMKGAYLLTPNHTT